MKSGRHSHCEHGLPYWDCRPCKTRHGREYDLRTGRRKPHQNLTDLERFEIRWMPVPFSGCWIWLGDIFQCGGHGAFRINGKRRYKAHRAAWELYRGQIPEGLQVNHKCDVPSCVNPDHLYLGTQAQNNEDCRKRGRFRHCPPPTHCPHGHEYTPENSLRPPKGHLRCRACSKVSAQRHRAKRRAAEFILARAEETYYETGKWPGETK